MDARALAAAAVAAFSLCSALAAAAPQPGAEAFEREVGTRLKLPAREQARYSRWLEGALAQAGIAGGGAQYFVLIDRSPRVQAALVYWRGPDEAWTFVGASSAATGKPGEYEHFVTPLGVFEHSTDNLDFRAEGTRNSNGILGYGRKGMRVFDFGWVPGERGWGARGVSLMRLQLHATDPDLLEPLLGAWRSKGCIRIPASLNEFIDRHGLLDADYEQGLRAGREYWVLRADRTPTATPGRWLVVIDSGRSTRPAWSPPSARR